MPLGYALMKLLAHLVNLAIPFFCIEQACCFFAVPVILIACGMLNLPDNQFKLSRFCFFIDLKGYAGFFFNCPHAHPQGKMRQGSGREFSVVVC